MQIAKSQSAYEYIKEMILTGELSPRIDISEKQLQQELGISRTPVHEALKRLQDEGFVETYARKGTFVADVTIETVQDLLANCVDYMSADMISPVVQVNKYLAKSKSARMRLENPPKYKPKKKKKKKNMFSTLTNQ